jgi:protein-L-isoaspartate(D-aspartate) O-methyltransferase
MGLYRPFGSVVRPAALLAALLAVVGCGQGPESEESGTVAIGLEGVAGAPTTRPRADERLTERRRMVEVLRGYADPPVTERRVLDAMLAVPRHAFVPPAERARAYDDSPLPIGLGQTISQPYIVALMTEVLATKPGDRVLEIGTGSGYQAAVLAELGCSVYTVEIFKELGETARDRLAVLNYPNVEVRVGDGYFGWKEHAPYDAIIVTCAATHVPPALIEQLKPGGRLVIPVGQAFSVQDLVLLTKEQDGRVRSRSITMVRFVPLQGGHS